MSIEKYLQKIEDFTNKKVLITGATSGIGLEAAKILAKKEANIVLLARNKDKADKVKKELLEINPDIDVDYIPYDQSDYESIDNAIKIINEKHSDYDSVVLNAGILYPPKDAISKQGYPLTIDTNYLGMRRFLSQITKTCHQKRFIMQASLVAGLHISKKVDIYNGKYSLFKQYNISKCCIESLWYSYQNNPGDNEFILVEPGITSTDIIRGFKQPIKFLGELWMKIFSHTPKKASLTIIKALSKEAQNGDYYVPKHWCTMRGYPKKKKFPKKRIREYLLKY